MTAGASLVLIAIGAILRYAVTRSVSGVDLRVVGLVLMIVGIVGLVLSLLEMALWAPRRRARTVDPGSPDGRGVDPTLRDQ
ncbi:MAG TPA: DUF6458 family protein [Solirubrobacteraceae bacterium]|nr:DUF6458 family protein [Solirubrobacteraceae bacterium]